MFSSDKSPQSNKPLMSIIQVFGISSSWNASIWNLRLFVKNISKVYESRVDEVLSDIGLSFSFALNIEAAELQNDLIAFSSAKLSLQVYVTWLPSRNFFGHSLSSFPPAYFTKFS